MIYEKFSEVCLCYVNTNSQGGYSQDSLIAQEIYYNLAKNGINVLDPLSSNSQTSRIDVDFALDNSEIVLLIGANPDNFYTLVEKYGHILSQKVVIPVYSQMSAGFLPQSIKHLSAIDYNHPGSIHHIKNTVLASLRNVTSSHYYNIDSTYEPPRKKSPVIPFVLGILITLLIALGGYLVFGPADILNINPQNESSQSITKQELLQWAKDRVTLKQLEQKGYVLEPLDTLDKTTPSYDYIFERYRIKDTDIILEYKTQKNIKNDQIGLYDMWAPASLLAPDKIGSPLVPYINSDTVYWPCKSLYWAITGNPDEISDTVISENTPITISSSATFGDKWQYMVQRVAEENVRYKTGEKAASCVAESSSDYLFASYHSEGYVEYYRVNKNTMNTTYISTLYDIISEDENVDVTYKHDDWKEYSGLFGEFISLYDSSGAYDIKYFVRKTPYDQSTQTGAFSVLYNAIKQADTDRYTGHKVYDKYGNVVYRP